jgi:predicted DNA-binding ribbon-helix-helix protein
MCRIFAGQDPETYESETRSIRLHGHSTSIRLERAFWTVLEAIAAGEGRTIPQFIEKLHDEVTELRGDVANFTSLLRCACLVHLGAGGEAQRPGARTEPADRVAA